MGDQSIQSVYIQDNRAKPGKLLRVQVLDGLVNLDFYDGTFLENHRVVTLDALVDSLRLFERCI